MLPWQGYEKCSGLAGGEDWLPPLLVTAPRLWLWLLSPSPSRALTHNRGVCVRGEEPCDCSGQAFSSCMQHPAQHNPRP